MLIEFRVKNFRSLRDEQVLSFVATKDKTSQDTHTIATGVRAAPSILRSAVIYGANASGKSNVLRALQFMQMMVRNSAVGMHPGQPTNAQPFRLDPASLSAPTEFEVTVLLDGVRYQYGFSLNAERVLHEHLLVYKAFKPQRWFERNYNPETKTEAFEFGDSLKGAKATWEAATRPNSLFLSMAVQLNSKQLRPLSEWFETKLSVIAEGTRPRQEDAFEFLKDDLHRQLVRNLVVAGDVGISEIEVRTLKRPQKYFVPNDATGEVERKFYESDQTDVRFVHAGPHGHATFDFSDESEGTRNFVLLSEPLLNAMTHDGTLVIDEFESSLHPLLVRKMIELFHAGDAEMRPQLLFTTHDTSLLSADLFRRDQIWFVEKSREQASSLFSLAEFGARKGEAIEKGYLSGRYGAIPFLGELPTPVETATSVREKGDS
jgi:hypothetical protein